MIGINQISDMLTSDPDQVNTLFLIERGNRQSALRSAATRKRNKELQLQKEEQYNQKLAALNTVINIDAVMKILQDSGLNGITIEELVKKVTPDEKGKQALAKYLTAKGLFRNVVEYLDNNGHISSRTYWSKHLLDAMLKDPQHKEWLVEKLSNTMNLGRLAEKMVDQDKKVAFAKLAINPQAKI